MSRPTPPALTVRYEASTRTFAAGNDVVVGRDLRADVRVAHPLISRAHLVLRFDQGRWLAIDNGSLNGMYVNGRRVPGADIADTAGGEGGDRGLAHHAPARRRMSFSTPAAVTSAPAPGPVMISGLALYRAVVKTSWLSEPWMAASGLDLGTARRPTAIFERVTVAT